VQFLPPLLSEAITHKMEDKDMRTIKMGMPSGTLKLVLWEGTEDEKAFKIRSLNNKPYVLAYGVRYNLTSEEIKYLNILKTIL